jgi:hypothetical protein
MTGGAIGFQRDAGVDDPVQLLIEGIPAWRNA